MKTDWSASELARGLNELGHPDLRHNRIAIDMLDDRSTDYWRMTGTVADAQRAFASARAAWSRARRSNDCFAAQRERAAAQPAPAKRGRLATLFLGPAPVPWTPPEPIDLDPLWDAAVEAGEALAAQLAVLGDHRWPRCGRPTAENNTCTSALDVYGNCVSGMPGHSDGGPGRPYRHIGYFRYMIIRDDPTGRDVSYLGDDPSGFADQVRDQFGFDPATQPHYGHWTYLPEADRTDENHGGYWTYHFRCPAEHYAAITSRWPVKDAAPPEPDDAWTASGGTIEPDDLD